MIFYSFVAGLPSNNLCLLFLCFRMRCFETPQIIESMVPSESSPQELSNEWSCQYVLFRPVTIMSLLLWAKLVSFDMLGLCCIRSILNPWYHDTVESLWTPLGLITALLIERWPDYRGQIEWKSPIWDWTLEFSELSFHTRGQIFLVTNFPGSNFPVTTGPTKTSN
jgi:hypothetical protein